MSYHHTDYGQVSSNFIDPSMLASIRPGINSHDEFTTVPSQSGGLHGHGHSHHSSVDGISGGYPSPLPRHFGSSQPQSPHGFSPLSTSFGGTTAHPSSHPNSNAFATGSPDFYSPISSTPASVGGNDSLFESTSLSSYTGVDSRKSSFGKESPIDKSRKGSIGKAPRTSTTGAVPRRFSTNGMPSGPPPSGISMTHPTHHHSPHHGHAQQHHGPVPVPNHPGAPTGDGTNWATGGMPSGFGGYAASPPDDMSLLHHQARANMMPASAPVLGAAPPMGRDRFGSMDLSGFGPPSTGHPDDPTRETHNAQAIMDKKAKRRASHNMVERRRRDLINDRIAQLATMIPQSLFADPLLPTTGHGGSVDGADTEGDVKAPSAQAIAAANKAGPKPKGTVLAAAVEYIKHLEQLVEMHVGRNRELELLVSQMRGEPPPPPLERPLMGLRGMPAVSSSESPDSQALADPSPPELKGESMEEE